MPQNENGEVDLVSAVLLSPRGNIESKFKHLQMSLDAAPDPSPPLDEVEPPRVAAVIADVAAKRFSGPQTVEREEEREDDSDTLPLDVDAAGLCQAMLAGRFGALQRHFAALASDEERQAQTDAMRQLLADLKQVRVYVGWWSECVDVVVV